MDDFLSKLYEDEMAKVGSASRVEFMSGLPEDELAAILGITKVAVDGTARPELPSSASGAELDAKQRAVSENVNKEHLSAVPKRKDLTDPNISYAGEGKQPEGHEDEALRTSKEAMAWADQMGRMLAKTASSCKQSSIEEQAEAAAKRKREKEKRSMGGDEMGTQDMGGMETTAAVKAKIAQRALAISRDAPAHIKQAAAAFAGRKMAELR